MYWGSELERALKFLFWALGVSMLGIGIFLGVLWSHL